MQVCVVRVEMERMTRRQILVALSMAVATALRAAGQTPTAVRVYRDPACCCKAKFDANPSQYVK